MFRSRIIAAAFLTACALSIFCSKPKVEQNPSLQPPLPAAAATETPVPHNNNKTGDTAVDINKPQSVDVLSGDVINRSLFEDFNGDRIFFCCEVSRNKFKQDPMPYLQKIRERGIILEKAKQEAGIPIQGESGKPQSVDLISGKPIDKNGQGYGDYEGERVYFCCPTSKRQFDQNVKGYLEAIKGRGIILAKSPAQ